VDRDRGCRNDCEGEGRAFLSCEGRGSAATTTTCQTLNKALWCAQWLVSLSLYRTILHQPTRPRLSCCAGCWRTYSLSLSVAPLSPANRLPPYYTRQNDFHDYGVEPKGRYHDLPTVSVSRSLLFSLRCIVCDVCTYLCFSFSLFFCFLSRHATVTMWVALRRMPFVCK
jgi:hypothetical protein